MFQNLLIFVLLFTCAGEISAQRFLGSSKKDALKLFTKDSIDVIEKSDKYMPHLYLMENDTYYVHGFDSINGYHIKFTINYFDTTWEEYYVDYEEITYDCSPCSQLRYQEAINDLGHLQYDDTTYFAKPFWKHKMIVDWQEETGCLKLKFYDLRDYENKAYKTFYKSLKEAQE